MNPTCADCGGRLRGKKKCSCPQPHDHWKPIKRRRISRAGAGFNDGSGRFKTPLPSFFGTQNLICRNCGGSQRGQDRVGFHRCRCDDPDFPNIRLDQSRGIQAWHTTWLKEAYRVLRPGGVIKVFAATRTEHRLVAAMVDAGFEIVGLEAWTYATGFPKSMSLGPAIDKYLGAEREVVGMSSRKSGIADANAGVRQAWANHASVSAYFPVTVPATEEARKFEGFGTALKPAWEPFVVGRKHGKST